MIVCSFNTFSDKLFWNNPQCSCENRDVNNRLHWLNCFFGGICIFAHVLVLCRDRFLVLNYSSRFDEALQQLATWYMSGQLKVLEFIFSLSGSTLFANSSVYANCNF